MPKNFTVKLDDETTAFLEEVAGMQGVPCTEILREALNYYRTTGGGESLLVGPERGFERGKQIAAMLNLAFLRELASRMPTTYEEARQLYAEMATENNGALSTHLDALESS